MTHSCRLITGGKDGCLKVWNFNNGQCLKTLRRGMYCNLHFSLKIKWLNKRLVIKLDTNTSLDI